MYIIIILYYLLYYIILYYIILYYIILYYIRRPTGSPGVLEHLSVTSHQSLVLGGLGSGARGSRRARIIYSLHLRSLEIYPDLPRSCQTLFHVILSAPGPGASNPWKSMKISLSWPPFFASVFRCRFLSVFLWFWGPFWGPKRFPNHENALPKRASVSDVVP